MALTIRLILFFEISLVGVSLHNTHPITWHLEEDDFSAECARAQVYYYLLLLPFDLRIGKFFINFVQP